MPDHTFLLCMFLSLSLFILLSPGRRCVLTMGTSDQGKPVAPTVVHTSTHRVSPAVFLQYTHLSQPLGLHSEHISSGQRETKLSKSC